MENILKNSKQTKKTLEKDECAPEAESASSEEEDSESEKIAEEMNFPAPEARARAEGKTTPVNQLGLLGGAATRGSGRSYGVAASRCLRRLETIFPPAPAPERESGKAAISEEFGIFLKMERLGNPFRSS